MRSTFHGLETSKRSLFVQSTMMQTLGHNIANASTDGYTRQRVNATATRPLSMPGMFNSVAPGQLGTGVQYDSITRIRDSFLDVQFRRENQTLGSWSIVDDTIRSIEGFFNEPTENGMRSVMDKFWNSWEVLNRDPSLLSARVEVVGAATNMTNMMKHIDESLTKLENDINSSINIKVNEANDIINNIANLTDMIKRVEGTGDNANDFRDQRDLLIDKLSTIVDVQVTEGEHGDMTILAGGVTVVENAEATPITADIAATAGQLQGYALSLGEVGKVRDQMNAMVQTMVTGNVQVELAAGYVASSNLVTKSTVELENGMTIPPGGTIPAGARLKSAAQVEVNGFNGLHSLGYSLSDPAKSGIPFFTSTDGGNFSISNIQVNPEITNDVSKIAASGRYDTVNGQNVTVKGNSVIAHALASLRDKTFNYPSDMTSLSTGSVDDYYRAMMGDMGTRAANAERNVKVQNDMVDSVIFRRQSVSGVSLDEEMADMIRFQHAYNAAARNMTTVDEMLDKVINQMGVVGR
ncbi:flagellar hook-associated protein FlgK [Paenibacillus sp. OSY-SE]|uniref:flagellar hook-associated protein FlgK n=1 Tax=Paenibacillus sp. OSY-SE TaxID=1196323 RepID=UPI0003734541|nr:flagellar hook-associated protein FlgK [Paenibacillus sp. OSY-SE]